MSDNIYNAPESEVLDPEALASERFYVVSMKKFTVLFLATLGLYGLFWFYKHWQIIKDTQERKIWPVPRAIFSIFFAHALFREFEEAASEKTDTKWNSGAWATSYVIFNVCSTVLDRLSTREIGSPGTDVLSILVLFPMWQAVYQAQKRANLACGDPEGHSNARFSGLNMLFIVLGSVLWLMVIVGMLIIVGVIPEDLGV